MADYLHFNPLVRCLQHYLMLQYPHQSLVLPACCLVLYLLIHCLYQHNEYQGKRGDGWPVLLCLSFHVASHSPSFIFASKIHPSSLHLPQLCLNPSLCACHASGSGPIDAAHLPQSPSEATGQHGCQRAHPGSPDGGLRGRHQQRGSAHHCNGVAGA